MKTYLKKRILSLFMVLVGISIVSFALGIFSPGDPAELALSKGGNYTPTEDQIIKMREKMGLDEPYAVQYFRWLKNIFHGDLGMSYATDQNVFSLFMEKLPITLRLGMYSFLLTCIFGLGLGVFTAWHHEKFWDHAGMTLANMMLSIPGFWLALLMILIFAEQLKWLPTSGYGGISYIIMPALVISFATTATTARLMRSAMLSEYGKLYYVAGFSRGIGKLKLTYKHILRNAILPVIPMLGNYLGAILGGSAIVEVIFALPGIGSFAIESIAMKDYPVIQSYVLFTGFIYVTVSTGADILAGYLNPKIKLGNES